MYISSRLPVGTAKSGLARMSEDIRVARSKDPASTSFGAAVLHTGVHAIWLHRLSHNLQAKGFLISARLITYFNRLVTGVDLHPGATVEPGVFIDHGTGVVIGETAVLQSDVMLYHNVTVGSVGWWNPKVIAGRRHPIIGRGTILCTGALVLGPITVEPNCVIGANSVILADVPAGTRIPPGQTWPVRPAQSATGQQLAAYLGTPSTIADKEQCNDPLHRDRIATQPER